MIVCYQQAQFINLAGANLGKSVAERFISWAQNDGSQ
jgi:hypothetical protein